MKTLATILLASCLAGCSTARSPVVSMPVPREAAINSLALEQCVQENGAERCTADVQ
jgi:hypothetical protein